MVVRNAEPAVVYTAGHLRAMAADLRHLREWSSIETVGRDGWYREARAVVERWHRDLPQVPIAHEIWHYLHDADIRLRDPAYLAVQEARMDAIIADLERGVLPGSGSVSMPLRWPLVAILVLIGVAVWRMV